MLSAGFATVIYLKSRLLPLAAADDTEEDAALADLGKSVAGRFDKFCNRRFARTIGHHDEFSARGSAWVLSCFPVEEIASVAVRDREGGTVELDEGSWSVDESCGLLETDSIAGARTQRLVVTYTGGYWLDPRDGTALPAGADRLPDDILEAWIAQCQHVAESRGLFGAVSLRKQKDQASPKTSNLLLLEDVVETLNPYRRFAGE